MVRGYVLRSISKVFFPLFFILFFITSVMLVISISVATENIKINAYDLLLLFYYGMPNSLFLIVAISFYSACVLGISKLSYESEMLVLFSLGLSPNRLVLMLLPTCLLASLALLLMTLTVNPISKVAYKNFINSRTNSVNINIEPGDLGQKLGDWLLYIDKKTENTYYGLVLYSGEGVSGQESFIISKSGVIENNKGILELHLSDGDAYFAKNSELRRVHFDKMIVRNNVNRESFHSYNILDYWKEALSGNKTQARRLSQSIASSLFPIASIFFIPFFGIKNPRYQRNNSYAYTISSVVLYFIAMYTTSFSFPLITASLPMVWFFVGFFLFKKYISKHY